MPFPGRAPVTLDALADDSSRKNCPCCAMEPSKRTQLASLDTTALGWKPCLRNQADRG
jgi:hypothetical protein